MNLQEKYARVILETCLKLDKGQPLFISYDKEIKDFILIVTNIAKSLGVEDIYYDEHDTYYKHELLKTKTVDELIKTGLWDRSIWNEYGKKNAAFLMLVSEHPGLMKDIDSKKMSELTKYVFETCKEFEKLRDKSMLAWCIAAVPVELWAKTLYKEDNAIDLLWDDIFNMCLIKENDPVLVWNNKIKKLEERAKKLTDYQFKTLVYNSSNGTNFTVNLPKNHLWASGKERLSNGKEVLVNYPTEEIFLSPDCLSANGIVYSSKPLSYQGNIINDFYIRFENGKAVEYFAKEGNNSLTELINICENANMIGEISLVPYDSPISNMNKVFLETLFDENAACHIALGDSFPECILNGPNIDKDILFNEYHMNKCDSHIDFMVGTKDLNITGITNDGKEIPIFVNGNFSNIFE